MVTDDMQHASLTTLPGLIRLRIQLVYPEVVFIQVGLFLVAIWRGLDYVSPPNESPETLTAVEQAAPFVVWGSIFLTVGIMGIAGLRWPRFPLTAAAHYLAVALYFAFGVGALVSILARIQHPPSVLALAWVAVLMGSSLITLAVAWRWAPQYLSLTGVGVAAATITSLVIVASASGVYGWRTATGWLFAACVAHAMMGSASADAWMDHRDEREAQRDDTE